VKTIRGWLPAVLLVVLTSTAQASRSTPGVTAVKFEPQAFELGDYTPFDDLAILYNRDLWSYTNTALNDNPSVTMADLHDIFISGDSPLVYLMAHTAEDWYEVSPYRTVAARDAALVTDANMYLSGSIYASTHLDETGLPTYYTIGPTASFVQAYLQGNNAAVFQAGCSGAQGALQYAYQVAGVSAFVGFTTPMSNTDVFSMSTKVFTRMTTSTARTIGQAVNGGNGVSQIDSRMFAYDPYGTVLAPTVIGASFERQPKIQSTRTDTIYFDCSMTQSSATSLLGASTGLTISNVHWVNPATIAFTSTPKYKGPVRVTVYGDRAFSETGVPLDGNREPYAGPDGIAPSGDDRVCSAISTVGGDNPAALVTAFTAIDRGAGVELAWTVEFENQTERYRIDRSTGWSGLFETVTTVTADGSYRYSVHDPSGTFEHVYRLVEVEVNGRELKQAEEQAVAPFEMPADMVISEGVSDSLHQTLMQQYPSVGYGPSSTQPMYEWLAVIKDETYAAAIQPLVNFHQSRGRVATAMTLTELGGVQGIQPFVRWAASYGLRYLTLCGDANNWQDHNDPTSYYGGYLEPPYSAQPTYDIIPMSASIPDPMANQLKGLPYFTSRLTTDALYGDVDGDSLADIAVSRIPCRTPAELSAMVNKIIAGHNQSSTLGQVGVWGEFRNLSGNDGPFAQLLCDSLIKKFPVSTVVRKLYNTDTSPIPYVSREALAISALNEGRSIIMLFGTQSNRSKWAIWLDKTQGFNWAKASTSSTLPYLVAASCDIVDVCRSEDPAYGRPLFEDGLLQLGKAPYAGWGPTRGSWQHDDFAIASLFYDFAFQHGASSGAEALMMATREYGRRGPEYKYQALEMVHFGDAAAIMPGMVNTATAAVHDQSQVTTVQLSAPSPNPVRGQAMIRYTLPTNTNVTLSVIDVQGRVVSTVASGVQSAGVYSVEFSSTNVQPGMYFLRLQAGSVTRIEKMVLIH